MGLGSFFKDFVDFSTTPGSFFGAPDRQKRAAQKRYEEGLRVAAEQGDELARSQLLTGDITANLTTEQLSDLLINNPNIVTPGGRQFFNPATNTIRLEESPFQEEQRLRQEGLAAALTDSLTGELPSIDTETVTQATFEQGKALLDPVFTQQRRQLEQQLADQGLPPGSQAYNEAITRLETSQGSQLSQLSLGSVLQGIQTAEAQRAARFNEISSLLGQQQVGGIGFGQFQPRASGLDIIGQGEAARNRAFQDDIARRQQRSQERAGLFSALGSLGGAGLLAFSDARLKENIEVVGKSDSGLRIVEFEYINKNLGEGRYRGVLAQDVQKVKPEAVGLKHGFKAVNYGLIDVDFRKVS